MQQTINTQELENALNKYGDIVLTKNSKNDVIIMSISEYKRKLKDNELSKKLEKAEEQIKDGKTVKATTVFRELEEKYGCFQIMAEMIDSRNYYYQFYKNGRTIKSLKIFLDNSFGAWNIGFSNDSFSMVGGNHSWNGMYSAKCINGNLCLSSMMSLGGRQNGMTTEDYKITEKH